MDRRETVEVFRERLTDVIERSGLSRSAFATSAGLDRSTLSQLLSSNNDRLPRAETIAAIASAQQVSVDWLLGLSQIDQEGINIMGQPLEIESGAGSPVDERLIRWHAEAEGYKIRYVPTTLPDLLKTEAVTRYEYRDSAPISPERGLEQASHRLEYSRRPETDLEACSSFQSVQDFARGHGIWAGLPAELRHEQLLAMMSLVDELYPAFRWFLFDGLQRYSVPVTLFGRQRAAAYFGNMYFVFNSTEHIRVLNRHFDELIRSAVIQPTDIIGFLERQLADVK